MVAIYTSLSLPLLLLATHVGADGVTCTRDPSWRSMFKNWCMCQPCNLCEYKIFKGCRPLPQNPTTLSDGSDIPLKQPLLASKDWFLSEDDITKSRGGERRDRLTVSTSGNRVNIFADTSAAFASMHKDISMANSAYFSGWTLHDIPYIPQIDPSMTFKKTWAKAIATNNLHAHGIVWENLVELNEVTDMFSWMNMLNNSNCDNVQLMTDDRINKPTGSHHQKSLILTHNRDMVSYVGGLDQSLDRWDTKYHNETALRKRTGINGANDGWVDVHARLHGPATKDVLHNFLDRWNDPVYPGKPYGWPLVKSPVKINDAWNVPKKALPPTDILSQVHADATAGPHDVQILRTYSCKYKGYKSFAPKGETSIFAGRIKAIRNAKNYIYIEDQYFIHVPELLDELLKILPHIQRLIVFTVTPQGQEAAVGYQKYQYDMMAPLLEKFPKKVQIYVPDPRRNIYVHSKVLVVDDVFVSLGSSNWNVRSMTSDGEIGANVVDTTLVQDGVITVTKLARDFRIAKFSELTGFSVDLSKKSFLAAADALDAYAKSPNGWIKHYNLYEKPFWVIFRDVMKHLVDGDGRCSKLEDGEIDECQNLEWLETQPRVVQVTCECQRSNFSVFNCPAMTAYMQMEQEAIESTTVDTT